MLINEGRNKMLTFDEILLKEPRLISVINQAFEFNEDMGKGKVERNRFWYKKLKPQMIQLIGFGSKNNELKATETYELVYRFFIKLLKI